MYKKLMSVGAVIVRDGKIVSIKDPAACTEIIAIRKISAKIKQRINRILIKNKIY